MTKLAPFGIFQFPIDVDFNHEYSIYRETLIWLSNPIREIRKDVVVVGAFCLSDFVRRQVEREKVLFWRTLLGSHYKPLIANSRLNNERGSGDRGFDSSCSQNGLIKELETLNQEHEVVDLLYDIGIDEVWGFLQKNMHFAADRIRLLFPPERCLPARRASLSDEEWRFLMGSFLEE